MRVLKLKQKHKALNSGAYGIYIRLDRNKGVKIISAAFNTKQCVLGSDEFEDAKFEAWVLQRAYKSGVVPKCYGARIVLDTDGYYHAAIVMQHLGQQTLLTRMEKDKIGHTEQCDIESNLRAKLLKVGVEHNDLHCENVMYRRGKYYAIDFGPNAVDTFNVPKKPTTVQKFVIIDIESGNDIKVLEAA